MPGNVGGIAVRQDPVSGTALVAGALMVIVTMVLHPVGGDLRTDIDHLSRIASIATKVHVLAIVGMGVQVFGFIGLGNAIGLSATRARAGLIAFAMAWIAGIGAALASGILAPELIRMYPGLDAPQQAAMQALWHYNGLINRSLARVFIAGSCVGMILWSLITLRHDGMWRIVSFLGILVGAIGLITLLGGYLRIDVHGFGMFVLGYSAWMIAAGAALCRPSAPLG